MYHLEDRFVFHHALGEGRVRRRLVQYVKEKSTRPRGQRDECNAALAAQVVALGTKANLVAREWQQK